MLKTTNQSSPRKGDSTREAVIEAAYELFVERGYSATSMREIANRAGLALGGLYNHFPSKEVMFGAVFLERHPYLQMMTETSATSAARAKTLPEAMDAVARNIASALDQNPRYLNLLFIEIVEFKSAHFPELLTRVAPMVKRFSQAFAEAQARGEMRPMPVSVAVRAFLGLHMSRVLTQRLLVEKLTKYGDVSPEALTDVFLHGVLVAPNHKAARRAAKPVARRNSR